jgi:hypothetical protein
MKLRERLLRWWRPGMYYDAHPLSDEERRALEKAEEGVGQSGVRGGLKTPFGRPPIPEDDRPPD